MRLKQHLIEAKDMVLKAIDIADIIKKDCQPFLKMTDKFFYRGSRNNKTPDIKRIKPRKNRRPLSTEQKTHDMLDEMFKKKFGWKARSEGVFATINITDAIVYGVPYLFFPIGNFKFLYSPYIVDSYIETRSWDSITDMKRRNKKMKIFIDKYTDKNLKDSYGGRSEVVFKCKSYYIVNTQFKEFLKEHFNI